MRCPFWEEFIVGDGTESRCKLCKRDFAFGRIQRAKVGVVACIERGEAGVTEIAGFIVVFLVEEGQVLDRCDLECHGNMRALLPFKP